MEGGGDKIEFQAFRHNSWIPIYRTYHIALLILVGRGRERERETVLPPTFILPRGTNTKRDNTI